MLLLLLIGCPKAVLPPGQAVVEDIHFKGLAPGLFSPDTPATLSDQMTQRASRRFIDVFGPVDLGPYIGDVALLNEETLKTDGERIVTWYQDHGWFDARFVGWDAKKRKFKARNGGARVDLVGTVAPGTRSIMDADIEVVGTGGDGPHPRPDLVRLTTLRKGDPFDVSAWRASKAAIQAKLAEKGFVWATLDGRVDAWPEEGRVHATITVDQGKSCRFGPIKVQGKGDIPEARILQELRFETGDPFRPSKLSEARQKLYALGVYSIVELSPDLSDRTAKDIPITVRLKRRPSRTLQLGPAVQVETDRQQLTLKADYADTDALHRLYRWTVSAEAGAAATVDTSLDTPLATQLTDTAGPVAKLETTFTIPGLAGGVIQLGNAASGMLGVEPGYRELEVEASPSTTWQPNIRTALTLDYRIKYHQYFDYTDFATITASNLGVSLQPRYVLSIVEQKLTYDGRDDKLAPVSGEYASMVLGEAGGPLGGDFGFFRPTLDLRGYAPLRRAVGNINTVLALRAAGGIILTYVPDDDIDVDERLYLGGGSSVRGWGERRLGPSLEQDGVLTPVGGNLSLNGTIELRQRLPLGLGVVGFLDTGRVWDDPDNFALTGLSWSVGGGLRYFSPIGPIRADVGYVVDTGGVGLAPGATAHPWSVHLGLGEAF